MSPELASALIERLSKAQEARRRQRLFYRLFPAEDTVEPDGATLYARHRYAKHLEFFAAGAEYRERCFMAANRVGKTFGAGGYETACHLTGEYPRWWAGRRFDGPVRWWAAGKTNETTRNILQATLLGGIVQRAGRKHFDGTGVLPGERLGAVSWKQGVSDLADTIKVQHVSGGWSTLGFKSYQQGRGSFEGTAQHGIWLDEEPPMDVYGECIISTADKRAGPADVHAARGHERSGDELHAEGNAAWRGADVMGAEAAAWRNISRTDAPDLLVTCKSRRGRAER